MGGALPALGYVAGAATGVAAGLIAACDSDEGDPPQNGPNANGGGGSPRPNGGGGGGGGPTDEKRCDDDSDDDTLCESEAKA